MRCLMNLILWAAALVCPCLPCVDGSGAAVAIAAAQTDDRLERVTFYEVP